MKAVAPNSDATDGQAVQSPGQIDMAELFAEDGTSG